MFWSTIKSIGDHFLMVPVVPKQLKGVVLTIFAPLVNKKGGRNEMAGSQPLTVFLGEPAEEYGISNVRLTEIVSESH